MTLESYNNLPLREDVQNPYEGLLKMTDSDNNPNVYEIGDRAVVLGSKINEDGGASYTVEKYIMI